MTTTRQPPLRFRFAGGHAPPARAAKARALFLAVFAAIGASIKGGDLNIDHAWAWRLLGGTVVGDGVVWLYVSRQWTIVDHDTVDIGSDHRAIRATIERRRGRHKGTRLVVVVLNARGYSTSAANAAAIFRRGLHLGGHVIIGVECLSFRAREVDHHRLDGTTRLPQYRWIQRGPLKSSASGVVLGIARNVGTIDRPRVRVGSERTNEGADQPSGNGHGIDARSIVIGRGTVLATRVPPHGR